MTTEVISDLGAQPALFDDWANFVSWVYFYGTHDGSTVKIGNTGQASLGARRRQHERNQLSETRLVLLAAVRGGPQQERPVKDYFDHLRPDWARTTNNTESFLPEPELIEYINWIRQQYYSWTSEDDGPDDVPSFPHWAPQPDRRVPLDEPIDGMLVQDYDISNGQLSGTPWARMARALPPHNDYYTPVELVEAARTAMGTIDLDPATHWVAARAQRITNYYHQYRSGLDNPWAGSVWINPPYGNNQPWFRQIVRYWDTGEVTQLCMLSPVWAFNTNIAQPVIDRSSAMVLLSPTPKFWGRHKSGRIVEEGAEELGVNHPHAILYMGRRVREFKDAFAKYGIPMKLDGGELCHGSGSMTRFTRTRK